MQLESTIIQADLVLLAFYELDTVAVGIFDEEDPGPAAHGVRLALEVHAASFFEPVRQGVKVFDGEGDVAVACPELVGLFLVVVEGELQSGLGVAWHGEEGVGRVVANRRLAGELQAKLVRVEIYAPVEIQDPVAGVYVTHGRSFVASFQPSAISCQRFLLILMSSILATSCVFGDWAERRSTLGLCVESMVCVQFCSSSAES